MCGKKERERERERICFTSLHKARLGRKRTPYKCGDKHWIRVHVNKC